MKKIDKKDIIKKGNKTLGEFKQFISRGNVVDLAVGVIIGGAFGKIVTSIVNDILMPLIGVLIGGLNFTGLTLKVKDATISYGVFIQNVIDFLIVAVCIFIIVKIMNRFSKKQEAKPEPVKKDEQVILLEEIRDLLKENSSKKTTKKTTKKTK